uniref:Flocculation protein FLO11-like n=1 Tax=Steinernema glaseri TaxID=37863 RepID=A0A1I7ZG85_9BILA
MPSAKEAPMPTPSVFCGCCRSPKKFKDKEQQRTSPDVARNPIQTVTASPVRPPVTINPIPQIVVTSPPSFRSSPKKCDEFGDVKSPRDVFSTARSSTDTTEYQSMAELVRGIRREAGVPETPRVVGEEKTRQDVQLNVENLTRVIEPDQGPSTSSAPVASSSSASSLAVTIEESREVPLPLSRHRSFRSVLSEMPQLIVYYVGFVYLWCISSMYHVLNRLL